MVATNRLTGHSKGFFSVYTLPPNQAASAQNQLRINSTRGQAPEYRDTRALILKKSRQLQGRLDERARQNLRAAAADALFMTGPAASTPQIPAASVQLTVTSPPFLDVVQYAQDNWLRCWFNDLDAEAIAAGITMSRTVEEWDQRMAPRFRRALPRDEARRLGRVRGRRSAQGQNQAGRTCRAARHRRGLRHARRYSSTSSALPKPPTSGAWATTKPAPTATGS